jgi:hypothetical protein
LDSSAHVLSRVVVSQSALESWCIKYSVTSSVKQTPFVCIYICATLFVWISLSSRVCIIPPSKTVVRFRFHSPFCLFAQLKHGACGMVCSRNLAPSVWQLTWGWRNKIRSQLWLVCCRIGAQHIISFQLWTNVHYRAKKLCSFCANNCSLPEGISVNLRQSRTELGNRHIISYSALNNFAQPLPSYFQ